MNKISGIIILLLFLSHSCFAQTQAGHNLMIKPGEITKDLMSLLYYNRDYLRITDDFKAYNNQHQLITKRAFFKLMATGNYLPLRLNVKENSYRLYPLPHPIQKGIKSTLKHLGETALAHDEMEGKTLPAFHFIDLNGKVYTNISTKGKFIVLNCWFIHCQVCNEEMPALNELVKKYKGRKDILFLAPALDHRKNFKYFAVKKFDYAIIPDQNNLMRNLKINEYPTSLIINKRGLIIKVVDIPQELSRAMDTALASSKL